MILGDYHYLESTADDRRSPGSKVAADAALYERIYRVVRSSRQLPMTPKDVEKAKALLVGFSWVAAEGGKRCVRRSVPHAIEPAGENVDAAGGPDDSPLGRPYVYCIAAETAPASGKESLPAARTGTLPLPDSADGFWLKATYRNLSFKVVADTTLAGYGSDIGTLPDEGAALRRGWLGYSRFVVKSVRDVSRWITLPQGLVGRIWESNELTEAGLANNVLQRIPSGIPFRQVRQSVTYTWVNVPVEAIPLQAINELLGKTNNKPGVLPTDRFQPARRLLLPGEDDATKTYFDGHPAGTLMLKGFSYLPFTQGVGNRWMTTISYEMEYNPSVDSGPLGLEWRGWAAWPAVVKGVLRYSFVSTAKTETAGLKPKIQDMIYPANGDFSRLFRPDQP
jgi:hypothetical protein